MQVVNAGRDIAVGEELSISYIDTLQTHAKRKTKLMTNWGFDCLCSACAASDASPLARRESDRRVRQIRRQASLVQGFISRHQPSAMLHGLASELAAAEEAVDYEYEEEEEELLPEPEELVGLSKSLVRLHEEEELYTRSALAYTAVAFSYSAMGDLAEAKNWGRRAFESMLIYAGGESEGAEDFERMIKDVEAHWSWNIALNLLNSTGHVAE
jgi:hypothetical protein